MMQPIEFGEFLKRMNIVKPSFGFEGFGLENTKKIERVVSLKDIEHANFVVSMPSEYLDHLLRRIGILEDPNHKVYRYATIRRLRVDPHDLYIGQKFVYRPQYISLLENFKELFCGFTLPRGISKLTPQIIYGIDKEGFCALAHYITPIFEVHNGKKVILDGVHRDFIIKNAGTTIESIVIEDVSAPFPCTPKKWDEVEIIDVKPERLEDRYFDLKRRLFRDLKSIGIDG